MRIASQTFAAKNPGAAIFLREKPGAAVFLAASPGRIVISVQGPVDSEDFIGVLQDARAAGHVATDDFSALVDMSEFTGVIDWQTIPKIKEIMPKGDSTTNKNAYVVRSSFFAMLAKINAVIFPKTQHATFKDEAEARKWLGWE